MIPSRRAALGAALLLAGVVAACSAERPQPKAPFTAVWVGVDSAPLGALDLGRLEAAGVRELFYDAAAVDWRSGAPRLVERFAAPLPRGVPVTLAVTGEWHAPEEFAGRTAGAWRESIEALELAAERRGARPVGVHFALAGRDGRAELARVLDPLREELGPRLHLSVEIEPERIASEETSALARAVDYVVVSVYGQPPGEPERTERWDPDLARERVAELDRLAAPYALAAWTLGSAQRRAPGGEVLERAPRLDVGALLRAPGLEPKPGSVFEGLGRQVIERVASGPARIGGWRLARGESVRVVRPTTAHLERFLALAAPAPGTPRLGAVLRRLPAADEALSLSAANVAAALAAGDAEPALGVRLVAQGAPAGRTRFRVVLENANDEPTDFGGLESNYLELRLPRGVVGVLDAGGFDAAEQLHDGERRTLRALREADTVRLYASYLGGGERIESGTVEVRGAAIDRVAVSGSFILPGGRELVLPARQVVIGAAGP